MRKVNFVGSWGKEWIADAHGIFITHDDVVFVADRDAHQICAFSRDGKLPQTLGRRHGPLEPFNHPADIAVGPAGDIYVADGYGSSQVHRFSRDGTLLRTWGRPGRGPGEFGLPHAVWVLPDGRVLVADRENCRVQVFTPQGDYLTEWPEDRRRKQRRKLEGYDYADLRVAQGLDHEELGNRQHQARHRDQPPARIPMPGSTPTVRSRLQPPPSPRC